MIDILKERTFNIIKEGTSTKDFLDDEKIDLCAYSNDNIEFKLLIQEAHEYVFTNIYKNLNDVNFADITLSFLVACTKYIDNSYPGFFDKIFIKKINKIRKCENCSKKGNMKKCTSCLRVYYCSRDCQKIDFKNHKKVCKA